MVDVKGVPYPKAVMVYVVFFSLRHAISYCDLEAAMARARDEGRPRHAEPLGGKVCATDCGTSAGEDAAHGDILADG